MDDANILPPAVEQRLTAELAALEAKTSDQLVVATVPSLQGYEIEDYGYRLGRAWGLGQKKANNGVILLVAPNERRVRIEVGYGLEPVLTDAFSSLIIQRQILPRFKEGDLPGGVTAGTQAIIQQLTRDRGEAEQIAKKAEKESTSEEPPWLLWGIILAWGLFAMFGPRRWRGYAWALLNIASGSSSGGGRGGGFSGGGGSFGGGGASGRW